jgi:hypothetical protein
MKNPIRKAIPKVMRILEMLMSEVKFDMTDFLITSENVVEVFDVVVSIV